MAVPTIRVTDGGRVVLRDCMCLCAFIEAPHAAVSAAALDLIQRYLALVPPGAINFYVDDEGNDAPVHPEEVDALLRHKIVEGFEPGAGSVRLLGSDSEETGYYCYYYGCGAPDAARPNYRNVLYFRMSTEHFQFLGAARFAAFLSEIANALPVSFAYGSPCLATYGAAWRAFRLALRYPGLDVLEPGAAAVDLDDQAAGIYWLSVLGPRLAATLGGAAALSQGLPPDTQVRGVGKDKLELRIGREPVAGDRNRKDDLPSYRTVARLMEGVLHTPAVAYFFDRDALVADRAAMVRWHRRFLD